MKLVGRECAVGGEVDEAFFLYLELLQFLLEAGPLLLLAGQDVAQCCLNLFFRVVYCFGGEAEVGELTGEGAFDFE